MHERLLLESKLTLKKTDEICRAAESMLAQMKVVRDTVGTEVNNVISQERAQTLLFTAGHAKARIRTDTAAQCNELPLHIYKSATKDRDLKKLQLVKTTLVAYC